MVNGAIGVLRHIERQPADPAEAGPSTSTTSPPTKDEIITLWFEFPDKSTGASAKLKSRPHVLSKPNTLSVDWVPDAGVQKSGQHHIDKNSEMQTQTISLRTCLCHYDSQITRWDV